MTDLLRVTGLMAGYGSLAVVHGLDLTVNEGEIVALLGPNGAGKSTTLLTISGLLPILGGTVEVFGVDVSRCRRPEQLAMAGLSHVPEDRALFNGLSVRENLRLGVPIRRSYRQAVAGVLEHFPELDALMDRKAGVLSGGEQQMLALGRALVGRPQLLLVDEMSLGLAPVVVHRILPSLSKIAAEIGCGVLLVEQHVEQALKIANRGYVMAHGELVAAGDAEHLLKSRALLESSYLGDQSLDGLSDLDPSDLNLPSAGPGLPDKTALST